MALIGNLVKKKGVCGLRFIQFLKKKFQFFATKNVMAPTEVHGVDVAQKQMAR